MACFATGYAGIDVDQLRKRGIAVTTAAGIGWTKSVGRIGTLIAPVIVGNALTAGMAETSIMSLFALPALLAVLSLSLLGLYERKVLLGPQ